MRGHDASRFGFLASEHEATAGWRAFSLPARVGSQCSAEEVTVASVVCPCGTTFEAQSKRATYCSATCRKRGSRAGLRLAQPTALPSAQVEAPEVGSVVVSVITDLGAAVNTPAGLAAVKLAQLVDGATLMQGSSVAAWVREMRAAIAEAKQAAPSEDVDPIDELEKKRRAGRGA